MKGFFMPGVLGKIGWLASQPADFRARIKASGTWRSYAPQQVLYEVGEEPSALFGLGEGALDLCVPIQNGELITVHRAEPGFWIGDSALFAKAPRFVSLIAAAPSRVFCVPAGALREMVREEPKYWSSFYELSHMNVSRAILEYVQLFTMPPRERLRRLLIRLGGAEGTAVVTQSELASLLGINRSSVRRALEELAEAGAIRTGYRSIHVIDRTAGAVTRND
ncbi:MAG: Crp/Fnr family transcriptional regulator [Rhizobiaceae bacterium]|nr:Crp/Fnr family transcriptional regulator [Rhizobiaceae bacterium]